MPLPRLRIILIAAGLLLTTNGPLLFFAGRVIDRPGFPPPWEDVAVRPVLLGFAALTTVLVVLDVRAGGPTTRLRPGRLVLAAVVVFPLWALVSTTWSEQPSLTGWRALVYVGLVFFAAAVAALDDRELVVTLLTMTVPAVLVSGALALARPSVGQDVNGFWQGVYTNPNSLGPVAALGVISALGAWWLFPTGRARALTAAFLAACLAVLYQTTSRTSWFALTVALAATAGVVGLHLLTTRLDRRRAIAITAPAVAVGATALGLGLWSRWDDPTFAQRRTIWDGALDYVDDRWLHGHGFFSFFEVPGRALEQPYFDRGSAHSSPLEVLLGLGVVGLVLFLVVGGAAFVVTVRSAWREPSPARLTWLAVVLFLLVENLTESFVLWFSYNWVLLCAAALRRPADHAPATDPDPAPEAVGVA